MDHQDLDLAADSRDMGTAQGASGSSSCTASGSGSGSRSSSPLPVEVPVQTEDGKSQDQTASNDAHGVEAKRKKLFALFQKKNKGDPEASGSVAADSAAELPASPTNKRPARSRAAKTRQTTLVDLTIEQDDEEWAPSSIASSSRPKKKSKAAKEVQQPPPPPRQRSPLPPLKLNVSGTGLADGQVAHSFFDRRPAGETSRGGSVAPTTKEKLARSAVSLGRKKPTMHVPWPSRESVHVLPPEHMSGIGADAAAARRLPFARSDVKGKGKAISNGAESLLFPSQGLAEEVRRKKRGRKSSLPLRTTNGSTLQDRQDAVPESWRDHSAFSSALERGKNHFASDANIMWTDRWRPRSAEEVLGSESSAKYLRDWLSELRLVSDISLGSSSSDVADKRAYGDDTDTPEPSVKRRKVQTSVDKLSRKGAKKGNGDASFIVHDDEDELYAFFENAGVRTSQQTDADIDDLGCGFDSQTDNQDSQDEADLDFRASDRLTNCILLHGPPGSGKTAAVFACADELNFEVFELFPGVGKRGSKELKEAVGALGRNHMVSGGGSGGGANRGNGPSGGNAFRALMSSTNGKVPSGRETKPNHLRGRMVIPDSSETEDSQPLVQEGEESTPTVSGTRPSSSTRQSLILIEEADVLFEDDRAFWTGVVDLVKQSKRPVILTCNDLSYIPQDLLPIQQVLPFQQLDREAALHYLSCISEAEGRPMTREAIEQTAEEALADEGHPSDHSRRRSDSKRPIDLRQAIHQLQFASTASFKAASSNTEHVAEVNGMRQNAEAKAQPEVADLARLKQLSRGLSSLSFAYAELARPFVRQSAGDEPSSPATPLLPSTSAPGSSDQLNGSTVSSGSNGAPSSSSDEVLVPPSLRVLRAQVNQKASPVALPLEGREDLLQQAVQEGALACIRSAFSDDGSARTAQCLTYEQDNFYAEDVHTQAEHLRSMLQPLLVPGVPLPPPPPSTRPLSLVLLEGKLPLAPDKFWIDYAPYVRLMVRIEDFEEVMRQYAHQQQQQQHQDDPTFFLGGGIGNGSRSLRPSTRLSRAAAQAGAGGERIIALDKEGLEAARKSASGFMELLWAAPAPASASAPASDPASASAFAHLPVPISHVNGEGKDEGGAERSLAAQLGMDAGQLPQVGALPM